jgi:hypothetical protein
MSIVLPIKRSQFCVILSDDRKSGKIQHDSIEFGNDPNSAWDVAWQTLTAFILAQAIAGIDVTSEAYAESIETVSDALADQYGD